MSEWAVEVSKPLEVTFESLRLVFESVELCNFLGMYLALLALAVWRTCEPYTDTEGKAVDKPGLEL